MDNKLPVIKIAKSAVSVTYNNRHTLVRALLFSSLTMLVFELSYDYLVDDSSTILFSAYVLIWSIPFTSFAVNCHRAFLLGPSSVPKFGISFFGKRETKFYLWANAAFLLFISLIFTLAWLVNVVISRLESLISIWIFLSLLPYILGFYIFSRISIILPAIAIDKRANLVSAWNLSSGQGWRLTVIIGVLPILLTSWMGIFWEKSFLIDVSLIIIGFVLLAIEIAALSLSYKFITQSAKSQHQS